MGLEWARHRINSGVRTLREFLERLWTCQERPKDRFLNRPDFGGRNPSGIAANA